MNRKAAQFILFKVMGWKYASEDDAEIRDEKAIFLAAPHTSLFDFVIGYLYASSVGVKFKVMIKKEAFFFPVGPILRALGGFPIDRSNPGSVIVGVMHEMQKPGKFYLCLCPEGTRKAVRRWKTGYHSIAMHTGAPVYLGHYDYRRKTLGHGPKAKLTGDARKDTDEIQRRYAEMKLTALHPDKYTTG